MGAQEIIKVDNILRLLITLAVVSSGFVTYKVWPLRERVSLAEQRIETMCENQKKIEKNQELCPTEKELKPVLEGIKKQLATHEATCEKLTETAANLEKALIRLESKL